MKLAALATVTMGSPVRNDGRGLKLLSLSLLGGADDGSPVRNDGRGLKRRSAARGWQVSSARPSEMTGVD